MAKLLAADFGRARALPGGDRLGPRKVQIAAKMLDTGAQRASKSPSRCRCMRRGIAIRVTCVDEFLQHVLAF